MPALPLRRLGAAVLAAALALAPAACDLDDSASDAPQLVQQWVLAEETAPAPGTAPNVEVEGGAALVRLAGEFVRTCTTGNVQVTHAFDGSNLTFRAVFTPAQTCANEAPTRQFVRYFAYLTQVPPGTYDVRVIHENEELAGGTGTVLQQTITVF